MTPSLPLTRTGLDIHRLMAELIGKSFKSGADCNSEVEGQGGPS
jgi:hypothetical protein